MTEKPAKEKMERRHSAVACLGCRKRKVRCNNDRPRCANCHLYDINCVFGEDRRRVPSISHLEDDSSAPALPNYSDGHQRGLSSKDDAALTTKVAASNLEFPDFYPPDQPALSNDPIVNNTDWVYWPSFEDDNGYFDIGHPHLHLAAPTEDGFTPPTAREAVFPELPLHSQKLLDYADAGHIPTPPTLSKRPISYSIGSQQLQGSVSSTTSFSTRDDSGSTVEDVTAQLTSRLGRLQISGDGRAHYFGPTSNLHLLDIGPQSLRQPNIYQIPLHWQHALSQAGLEWEGDPTYENRLIRLYFTWSNPLFGVLDMDTFFAERDMFRSGHRTDLYSLALENAVLAVGSTIYDEGHSAIPGSASAFFATRFRAYLEVELDSPTIATAQALLVQLSYEGANLKESRGMVYVGMISQIVADLGLQLSPEDLSSTTEGPGGMMDEKLCSLRRNLFWAVKAIDTLSSFYAGRPSLIRHMVHNVPPPEPHPTYKWSYYVNDHFSMTFPRDFDFHAAAYVPIEVASLVELFAPVHDKLYPGVRHATEDVTVFVAETGTALKRWYDKLRPEVRLDASKHLDGYYLPSVLELHLVYHQCVILLYRPLITPTETDAFTDYVTDPSSPFGRCVTSAQQICRILAFYQRRYTLKRPQHHIVHVALTASLVHVYRVSVSAPDKPEGVDAQKCFLTCIQALAEMGQSYASASRALEVVTSLRHTWSKDATGASQFKRARFQ